jgi:hypothetical protein
MKALQAGVLILVALASVRAESADSRSQPALPWREPRPEEVKTQVFSALDTTKHLARGVRAEALWSEVPPTMPEDQLLLRVATTFALINTDAAKLMALCSKPRAQLTAPSERWLRDGKLPPVFANNLRLFYAQWLVHESLFDEAQEQLAGLSPADVVAPASLLFQQGVVYRALLNKELGLKAIDQLLAAGQSGPRRYTALARLMQADLKGLKDDSLSHVARRMDDIHRRLDLGRAGPVVRREQDEVIKSLDKVIKKMEDDEEQKKSGGSPNLAPMSPAKDSRIAEGKGPGNVTRKDVGSGSGWGNLPPREREQAMQQIGRDLPPHYRDAVEQYFRRLAAEDSEKNK